MEKHIMEATILFADMVDSSTLSHVHDPFTYDALVHEFQRTAVGVVEEMVGKKSATEYTLPIRSINFHYREFQAVRREKHPTPAVAGCLPGLLTRASVDAGFPLQRHAV